MDAIQNILTQALNAFANLVKTGSAGAGNVFDAATGSVRGIIN